MILKRATGVSAVATSLTLGLLLAGCADDGEAGGKESGGKASSSKPHGYIAGAQEAAEQQSRLVLSDKSGTVDMFDLVENKTKRLGKVKKGSELIADGRFAYLGSDSGLQIFDSGAWMVDHGDHVHYYRAKTRKVGSARGEMKHVYSSPSLTAVTFADGKAAIVDHARLEKGEFKETAVLDDAERGPVVPLKENILTPVSGRDDETVIEVRDRKGKKVGSLGEKCPGLRAAAVTRTGVVYGCSHGALFITEKDGKPQVEKIPFGRKVPEAERPTSFHHRSLGATLTARAGDKGVWVLNVTKRSWKFIGTGPVSAVNSAGEGTPLLTLDSRGTLKSYEISDGKEIASRKILAGRPGPKDRPVIEVDASRAYVNDATAKKVYEIDYNDDLRTARSFDLGTSPSQMVETGR